MGFVTPNTEEYNLLSSFIVEALKMLGKDCLVHICKGEVDDSNRDILYEYDQPKPTLILFSSDVDVKLKNSYWQKETGEYVEAYIDLETLKAITKNSVIDLNNNYYNGNSKFLVSNIFGQIDSTYARVKLVPYRLSKATEIAPEKQNVTTEVKGNLIVDKPLLKR